MVKTIISIIITFLLIASLATFELFYVNTTFEEFRSILCGLHEKAEDSCATHEDGLAVQKFWDDKKKYLHVWLPHTSIEGVDVHLSEALGYLYEGRYTDALPKIEVLIDMSENIPHVFELDWGNIF
jgi:hypothetical protein